MAMKTMTDAEHALLNLVVFGTQQETDIPDAIGKVVAERLSPELRERAVRAHLAVFEAHAARDNVWEVLASIGYRGDRLVSPLWDLIEADARALALHRGAK